MEIRSELSEEVRVGEERIIDEASELGLGSSEDEK